jgi:hypothetical protein
MATRQVMHVQGFTAHGPQGAQSLGHNCMP